MSHEEFKKIDFPQGGHIEPCPLCASHVELWQRSDSPDAPTHKAVCCTNNEPIGKQTGLMNEGCVFYMPPEDFYRATIREAISYWNDYAKAITAQRRKNSWEFANVLRSTKPSETDSVPAQAKEEK